MLTLLIHLIVILYVSVWDSGQEMDAPSEMAHTDGSMQTFLLTRINVNRKPTHYNESLLISEQCSLPTVKVWLFLGDICINKDEQKFQKR